MLSHKRLKAFIPTVQVDKAQHFYENILGLKLLSKDPYGMEFDANGIHLRVTPVQKFEVHPFTVLGWDVDDITSMVKALNEKGVEFEKYGFLEQDSLGIWNAPGGTKVAWFKDPDGNLLSLSQ